MSKWSCINSVPFLQRTPWIPPHTLSNTVESMCEKRPTPFQRCRNCLARVTGSSKSQPRIVNSECSVTPNRFVIEMFSECTTCLQLYFGSSSLWHSNGAPPSTPTMLWCSSEFSKYNSNTSRASG